MKKMSLIALPLLLAVPGCLFKKNSAPYKKTIVKTQTTVNSAEKSQLSEADADIEEFVLLEEQGHNVFDSQVPATAWEQAEEKTITQEQGDAIHFDYDSIKIKPEEEVIISKNARLLRKALRKDKNAVALVEGHSCKIAVNPDYNHVLSYERAQTIADMYADEGVPRERIRVIGRGCTQPIAEQEGMQEQAPNRRVETRVITSQE